VKRVVVVAPFIAKHYHLNVNLSKKTHLSCHPQ